MKTKFSFTWQERYKILFLSCLKPRGLIRISKQLILIMLKVKKKARNMNLEVMFVNRQRLL